MHRDLGGVSMKVYAYATGVDLRGRAMHEITRKEQDQLLKIMRRHKKRLMQYPNVRSVDVGFKFRRKRPSDRLAIRVHVERKVPKSKLDKADLLPDEIDGIPLDVIQSNPELLADFRNSRQDPVVGGINVGNVKLTGPGTLGSIVFERGTLRPLALTAWHVIVAEPAVSMDPVIQPDPKPPDTPLPNAFLGRLLRWDEPLDAAVCSIGQQDGTQARKISTSLVGLPQPAAGSKAPVVGLKVIKSGLRTAVTRGIIDGTDGVEFSVIEDSDAPPSDGVLGGPGDSGSLWLDRQTHSAVGVLFKGEANPEFRIWAHSVPRICDKLNIFVLDTAAIGTAWIGGHCRVLASTRPLAPCALKVVYPSGRTSHASGLGPAQANAQGIVEWRWRIGTSTQRRPGVKLSAQVTLDGVQHLLTAELEGATDLTH
ncbi:hypothetical protein G6W55_00125 [Streptomyces sp. CAI-85]|nr:hypothetical protein [Streptomyces sp. CAI-85]